MAAAMLQAAGFILSLLGVTGIIGATGMDQWATEDLSNSAVMAVFSYSGLWRSCVQQTSGITECRPYFTILGLPALLQAVRALMIVGIVLGVVGTLISTSALKCLKMGNMEDGIKATMSLTAGVLFLLAGVCGISGVSAFANLIVQSFGLPANVDNGLMSVGGLTGALTPRYTLGPALFVGWTGAAGLIIGGLIMCLSYRGMAAHKKQRYDRMSWNAASQHTTYKPHARPRTNDSLKTHSVDGQRHNQRFNYV